MGGIGSGSYYRWRNKVTLEDCRNLDINRMTKLGAIQEGCLKSGSWVWTDRQTGEEMSKIGYQCNTLDKENSYLRLTYKFTNTDQSLDYQVRLVRTYPPYGGVRFWFICPERGKRIAKLFLIPSDGRFVSRHVYKVRYASQSKGPIDRMIDKKWRLVRKTGGDYFPVRPKGMHRRTFERIMDKFIAQEELCEKMLIERFGQLL